ncbi:MAG: hypothetical protein ACOX9E_16305 [Lentisphaeria bacterium]
MAQPFFSAQQPAALMAQPSLASAAFMTQAPFSAFLAQQAPLFAFWANALSVSSARAASAIIIMPLFLLMLFTVVSPYVVCVS